MQQKFLTKTNVGHVRETSHTETNMASVRKTQTPSTGLQHPSFNHCRI